MAYFLDLGRQMIKTQKLAFRLDGSTTFEVLGGYWRSGWRLLEAILGDLGTKLGYLGRSWRQDGTLLAACWDKDGEDGP